VPLKIYQYEQAGERYEQGETSEHRDPAQGGKGSENHAPQCCKIGYVK
jgi:hypothetical protein